MIFILKIDVSGKNELHSCLTAGSVRPAGTRVYFKMMLTGQEFDGRYYIFVPSDNNESKNGKPLHMNHWT